MTAIVQESRFEFAPPEPPGRWPALFLAVAAPNQAGFMQARVEALTILERDGQIKAFAKTEILGPERLDSVQIDLVHQEFFDLEPGDYSLSIELRDLNSSDTTVTHFNAPLAVGALPAGLFISDILFAERIVPATEGMPSKYGYQVVLRPAEKLRPVQAARAVAAQERSPPRLVATSPLEVGQRVVVVLVIHEIAVAEICDRF